MIDNGQAWETVLWTDIGWAVRVQIDGSLKFEACEIASTEWWLDGVHHTTPLYERAGALSSGEDTEDIAEAEIVFSGFVKWDGCSHWQWNTEHCMWHGCGLESIQHMGEAMRRVFILASERVAAWDHDLAGTAK